MIKNWLPFLFFASPCMYFHTAVLHNVQIQFCMYVSLYTQK